MSSPEKNLRADSDAYKLDEQIGFLLRKANQRHRTIFSKLIQEPLAPTQFATLVRLYFDGPTSQNTLGRRTAMDSATMTGVITRLLQRELVTRSIAPEDDRLSIIELTDSGRNLISETIPNGIRITQETLAPLTEAEIKTLTRLLKKIS
jgi:DNA-binding MarR family transcriptional regulator